MLGRTVSAVPLRRPSATAALQRAISSAISNRAVGLRGAFPRVEMLVAAEDIVFGGAGGSSTGRYFSSSAILGSGTTQSHAAPPPRVVVRVGDGQEFRFHHNDVMGMDKGVFLKAISEADFFRDKMKGVPLGEWIVTIVKSAGEVPTAEEEAASVGMGPLDTLQRLAGDSSILFVRVHLPKPEGEFRWQGHGGRSYIIRSPRGEGRTKRACLPSTPSTSPTSLFLLSCALQLPFTRR